MKKLILLSLLSLNACVLSNPENTQDSKFIQFFKALEAPSCYNCVHLTEQEINDVVD